MTGTRFATLRPALCAILLCACGSDEEPVDSPVKPDTAITETMSSPSSSTTFTTESLHDSAGQPTPPADTGRPDSGVFTLPGPGFDSTAYGTSVDTSDTSTSTEE